MIPFDTLYEAMLQKDMSFEGLAYVCVTSTKIVCRFGCPARPPLRRNVLFVESLTDAHAKGFRNCKRCKPETYPNAEPELVTRLKQLVNQSPDDAWNSDRLVSLGIHPVTARRQFKASTGNTFAQYVRGRRLAMAHTNMIAGEAVIMAQQDAGYESGSGFREAFQKEFSVAPKNSVHVKTLVFDFVDTPLGPMLALADDTSVHMLEFIDRKNFHRNVVRYKRAFNAAILPGVTDALSMIVKEVQAYFVGENLEFRSKIAKAGSEFQNEVWTALRQVPAGTTQSYKDLAIAIGKPNAVRAVANANGQNRCAIILPCHRIIGSDGKLTGYAGGLEKKAWLLEHERRIMGSSLV